jgi:ribosomal protein S18
MATPAKKKKVPLDKLKAWVSPKSTTGLLRDRQKEVDKKIKKAGG